MKKIGIYCAMLLSAACLFVSCDDDNSGDSGASGSGKCKVTFDLNGGTGSILSQSVEKGGKATKPSTDPSPSNATYYLFDCWAKADNTEFKFDEETITSDITLKAKWKDRYTVGQAGPARGIIFYDVDADNETGNTDGLRSATCNWRYLEAATSDLNNGNGYTWGSSGSFGTSEAIGEGTTNKLAISNAKASNSSLSFPAFDACNNYSYGGSSDWFLPSKDELDLMYEARATIGGFDVSSYWSSSEASNDNAWDESFYNGGAYDSARTQTRLVRPIRRF